MHDADFNMVVDHDTEILSPFCKWCPGPERHYTSVLFAFPLMPLSTEQRFLAWHDFWLCFVLLHRN